jgi:hypothetical protein
MQLGALVRMLLRQHLIKHSLKGVMDQYLQCLLAKVNNLSKYLIMLIPLKNLGKGLIFILNVITHETLEPTL